MARGRRKRSPRNGGMTTELVELSRLSESDPRPRAARPAREDAGEAPPPAGPPPASREDPEAGATVDMPTIDVPDWEDLPARRPAPSRRPAEPPPARAEPARPEPARAEPARAEPARAEPALPPARTELAPRPRTEPPPPIPFRHRPMRVELEPGVEPPPGLLVDPTPDLDPATGTLTISERQARRSATRERRERRAPNTLSAWRVRLGDWLLLLSGIVLLVALFLPWSHQFSAQILARYGHSPMLAGVPRSPDAWQVYAIIDAVLAILAAASMTAAFVGGRSARLVLGGAAAIALLFTLHAIAHAPTNGANIVNSAVTPAGYLPNHPRAGTGEQVGLIALIMMLAGVALSVLVLPRDLLRRRG